MCDTGLKLYFCPLLFNVIVYFFLYFRLVLVVSAKVRAQESKRQMAEAVLAKRQTCCVRRRVVDILCTSSSFSLENKAKTYIYIKFISTLELSSIAYLFY